MPNHWTYYSTHTYIHTYYSTHTYILQYTLYALFLSNVIYCISALFQLCLKFMQKKKIQIQKKETRVITNTNSWQLTMLPYCTIISYTPKKSHAFSRIYILCMLPKHFLTIGKKTLRMKPKLPPPPQKQWLVSPYQNQLWVSKKCSFSPILLKGILLKISDSKQIKQSSKLA